MSREQTAILSPESSTPRDHLRVCGADQSPACHAVSQSGSPPRVRSRRSGRAGVWAERGITSACAEQTIWRNAAKPRPRDHLRVCGADEWFDHGRPTEEGSPPRVRGRLGVLDPFGERDGITSACAEQTGAWTSRGGRCRDHLRVCGADLDAVSSMLMPAGSPPRVRSGHRHGGRHAGGRGITSACAEQTRWATMIGSHAGDHLRVCGADRIRHYRPTGEPGSPPRVRSRPRDLEADVVDLGITSACAEQTSPVGYTPYLRWNHLRVCGADDIAAIVHAATEGSPPRVRSRLAMWRMRIGCRGITSACAEQTLFHRGTERYGEDHLRVCGADSDRYNDYDYGVGSPPRVRSRPPAG